MILKWCLLFFLVVNINSQESPCPNIFIYEFNGNQWYGVIRIPSAYFGNTITLVLEMSLKSNLPFIFTGKIMLVGTEKEIIESIIKGDLLTYRVHFPVAENLPQINSIFINKIKYCSGEPATFSENNPYIFTIQLRHTLRTESFHHLLHNLPKYDIDPRFPQEEPKQIEYVPIETFEPTTSTTVQEDLHQQTTLETLHETTTSISVPASAKTIIRSRFESKSQSRTEIQCGVRKVKNSNALIAKGESTKPGDWPWLVALFANDKQASLKFLCTGSLLSQTHILTAAHCVIEKMRRNTRIVEIVPMLGTYNILSWTDPNQKISQVKKIHVHPNFNRQYHNDIALLEIPQIEYTDYIRPICLWRGENSLTEVIGVEATVVGWGKDEDKNLVVASPKMATVRIVSTDTCRNEFPRLIEYTTDKTICAGDKDGRGPCNGDSGGGLYIFMKNGWMLRGIVSNILHNPNSDDCTDQKYAVYTDAAQYMDWIKNVTLVT